MAAFPPSTPAFLFRFAPQKELRSGRAANNPTWKKCIFHSSSSYKKLTQQAAIDLINKAIPISNEPQTWADLGCGTGVFTNALANLLPNKSKIFAVDTQSQHLPNTMGKHVSFDFGKANFENHDFGFSNLDGILMANSLHFVKDKSGLLIRLKKYLNQNKKIIIVEYDTQTANQWVPFPIGYAELKALFMQLHFNKVEKIGEQKSIFGQGNLYAASIQSII